MEAWKEELYCNELYHHGILGQKWGIRRYQNSDGSYTNEGLRRYNIVKEKYDKSQNKLSDVKAKYKSGEASKDDLRNAKKENKKLKKSLNQHYKQLKKDEQADKGKALYAEGKSIFGERLKVNLAAVLAEIGTLAVSSIVGNALTNSGATLTNKVLGTLGPQELGQIANLGISAVGSAAVTGYALKKGLNERNLRSYYGHSRPSMPK